MGRKKTAAGRNLLVSEEQCYFCFYANRLIHLYFPLPQRVPIYVLERIPLLNRVLTSLGSCRGSISMVYVLL